MNKKKIVHGGNTDSQHTHTRFVVDELGGEVFSVRGGMHYWLPTHTRSSSTTCSSTIRCVRVDRFTASGPQYKQSIHNTLCAQMTSHGCAKENSSWMNCVHQGEYADAQISSTTSCAHTQSFRIRLQSLTSVQYIDGAHLQSILEKLESDGTARRSQSISSRTNFCALDVSVRCSFWKIIVQKGND